VQNIKKQILTKALQNFAGYIIFGATMRKRENFFANEMDALDTLFLFIFGSSLFVPDIGESFGIEKRFLWAPSLVFCGWVIYIGYFRATVKLSNFKELSFIERIRGWVYGLTLAITLFFNGLSLSGLLNPMITIATVVVLLLLTVTLFPRMLFGKQLVLFNHLQRKALLKVLEEVGVGSIYFSAATLIVQNTIFSMPPPLSIITDMLLFFPIIRVYYSEKRSRLIASDLATSLAKSRFLQQYQRLGRKKRNFRSKCSF